MLAVAPLAAHEYWLDPLDATPDEHATLYASVRNGEGFVGSGLPYDPTRMTRLELVGPEGARALSGRLGDYPAVSAGLGRAGLYLLAFETRAKPLLYDDRAAFATFLEYHGLGELLARHDERGLPDVGIRERYYRYVKSLVKAGDVALRADPDSAVTEPLGQRYELVPRNDPYVDEELALTVLYAGEPAPGAQVELFERAPDGSVTRVTELSDAHGEVRFDVGRPGEYLVNAVRVLVPAAGTLAGETAPPHWTSLWASLTFERP